MYHTKNIATLPYIYALSNTTGRDCYMKANSGVVNRDVILLTVSG